MGNFVIGLANKYSKALPRLLAEYFNEYSYLFEAELYHSDICGAWSYVVIQ